MKFNKNGNSGFIYIKDVKSQMHFLCINLHPLMQVEVQAKLMLQNVLMLLFVSLKKDRNPSELKKTSNLFSSPPILDALL